MGPSPFIEKVRREIRVRQYSIRTESSYLWWIKQFIYFNDKRHPEELGNAEIEAFLTHLAVNREVSSATQNQALCALIFMYRYVIDREIEGLSYSFTKTPTRMPTVLSEQEVSTILSHMHGKVWLVTALLYGCGLRISEVLRLRVKDINFDNLSLFIFRGKGKKDRYTLLPRALVEPLKEQIQKVKAMHKQDLALGYGYASLPSSLLRKYKSTAKDFAWQFLFPSVSRCVYPQSGFVYRHHIHETGYRKSLRTAVKASDLDKRVTSHTFRHSFATQLLLNGADIRTVQDLLGHSDVRTTEIYTHVIGTKFSGTQSPLERLK